MSVHVHGYSIPKYLYQPPSKGQVPHIDIALVPVAPVVPLDIDQVRANGCAMGLCSVVSLVGNMATNDPADRQDTGPR